jgi:DMSO/TMAO reductase YedYZ heme-binding membrane subunit
MTLTPRLRKFVLTAHVASSVGWLGAVAAFLALGLVGLTSQDDETVRAAYLVMEPAAWLVLVPLAVASLLTGLVQSLGTTWGLFRHYWVLFKLLINLVATVVLLIYMETFRFMADVAGDPTADLDAVRSVSPVLHAALALLLLLTATTLAVYKPRGMTPYGQRKQREQRAALQRSEQDDQRTALVP